MTSEENIITNHYTYVVRLFSFINTRWSNIIIWLKANIEVPAVNVKSTFKRIQHYKIIGFFLKSVQMSGWVSHWNRCKVSEVICVRIENVKSMFKLQGFELLYDFSL